MDRKVTTAAHVWGIQKVAKLSFPRQGALCPVKGRCRKRFHRGEQEQ
jgi:hypothetical protein